MCGIIGYFSKNQSPPDRKTFEHATDLMVKRGPDERGIWTEDRVGLGFRRLSIIDLKTGSQPIANEDQNLHLVFNGEIYNFQELRNQLEGRGHVFRTQSDGETILHLYEEQGESCVQSLRGMFAFAIHDRKRNQLFLARDRFGKKPLFYSETANGFYFASEISPLIHLSNCGREVHFGAVDSYLALQYVPGSLTAWRNIQRLSVASSLCVIQGKAQEPKRYWRLTPSSSQHHLSEEDALDVFRKSFEESVRMRMIADVPLGAFLSGGVDSSVTVAAMTQLGRKVKTFCVGFEEKSFDESGYAREVSRRLGTEHHELKIKADSLEDMDPLIDALGEPFADHSLLPTHALSRFTRQQVTVALSGDGGDECFAGYKRYRYLAQASMLKRYGLAAPRLMMSRLIFEMEKIFNSRRRKLVWPRSGLDRILPMESTGQYLELVGCWGKTDRDMIWKQKRKEDAAALWIRSIWNGLSAGDDLTRWQLLDVETYLADDILRKVDVASMACSLECRCPFLDHQTVELAFSLPGKFKMSCGWNSKTLLKKLYPKLIPEAFFNREKKGFSMPLGLWMRKQWKESVRASIEDAWEGGMENHFDRSVLRRIWNEHQEERQDHSHRLWAWLMLYRWNQRFKPLWPD